MQIASSRLDIRLLGYANVRFAGVPVKFAKRSTTLALRAFIVLQRGPVI